MANTIDNRIVSMQFDNKQFEKAVSETLISMNKLTAALQLTSASKGFAGVTAAAQKVDVSAISAGISSVNWSVVALSSVVSTVFRNITNSAISTGMKISKALSVDGAAAGFAGYENKMNATKTMMAATGKDIGTINKVLAELNDYADKTIYSFSDMTTNVSKFVNTGIALEDSVKIVRGLSNAAAVAGISNEALARAMFQVTQAMSAGFMRLEDWNPIAESGMATKEFKTQLLEAGVAMGTLKKTGKDTYKVLTKNSVGAKLKEEIGPMKMFTDSLQYKWLDQSTLVKGMQVYGDTTTEVGARAEKAAADVDTFTKMMETVKDSIKTGWSKTWEAVIGDKAESLKFWTDISSAITGFTGAISKSRIETLNFWNENGGRQAVINGLVNIFTSLGDVLKIVGRAFSEVFPKKSNPGEALVTLSKAFEAFTKKLQPSSKVLEGIRLLFKGLFSVLKLVQLGFGIAFDAIKAFLSGLFGVSGNLSGFSETIFDSVKAFAAWVQGLVESAKTSEKFAKTVTDIKDTMSKVGKSLSTFFSKMAGYVRGASETISKFIGEMRVNGKSLVSYLQSIPSAIKAAFSSSGDSVGGFSDKIAAAFKNVDWNRVIVIMFGALTAVGIGVFVKFVKDISDIVKGLGNTLVTIKDKVVDVMGQVQKNLQAKALRDIATAILLLAVALFIISKIPADKLKTSMAAISVLVLELVASMKYLEELKIKDPKSLLAAAGAMAILAGAILLMTASVAILGNMDTKKLFQGMVAVGFILAGMMEFVQEVDGAKLATIATGLLGMAGAMLLLTASVAVLGYMDLGALIQGMVAIGFLLAGIIEFVQEVDGAKLAGVAVALLGMAGSLLLLTASVYVLGSMDQNALIQGMLAVALLLGGILRFTQMIDSAKLAGVAAGLLGISGAVLIIAIALKILGSMDMQSLINATITLAAVLTLILVFIKYMSDPMSMAAAGAMIVLAVAIMVFALALAVLGALSWGQIIKGIAALALLFIVLGLAGAVMGTVVGAGVMALAVALLLIATAVLIAGAGVLLFSMGIMTLAAALTTGGEVILDFIKKVIAALPQMAIGLALAIGAFFIGMTAVLPQIFTFVNALFIGLMAMMVMQIPAFIEVMFTMLMAMLTAIDTFMPQIIPKVMSITVALLEGLTNAMPQLSQAGGDLIIAMVKGIGEQSARISDAALETIVKFLNSLSESIDKNAPKIIEAGNKVILSLYNALVLAVTQYPLFKVGTQMIQGLIDGINKLKDQVKTAVLGIVSGGIAAVKTLLGIKSPSRVFMDIGRLTIQGLIIGLENTQGKLVSAAETVVTSAYNAMAAAANAANNVLLDVTDPVIRPVIDLDNVYNGAKAISSLMSDASAIGVSGAVSARLNQDVSGSATLTPDGSTSGASVSLTQNNYSPKALSHLELYRQTQNQLRQLKGLGVV